MSWAGERLAASRTSPCTEGLGEAGQATVEAAALLPATMLVFALMLQPVCLAYTRAVMRSAAAECARAAGTAYGGRLAACRELALRRLGAVPEVALFHVGGSSDWKVDVSVSGGLAHVGITGHARPLPLMGALAALAGQRDATGVVLAVDLTEEVRPSWLEGDYAAWQTMWQ